MSINVSKVKIGAVNITPLAKITDKKMYADKMASIEDIDIYSWQTKIVAALLNEEAIEPVFEVERQTIKLNKIIIEEGKLTASIIPVKSRK